MTLDPDDPRPLYHQVADDLRHMIEPGGRYPPGARLPTVRQVADEYGLSAQTVQNAFRELRQQGLIVSLRGHGFFVADSNRPAHTTADTGQLRERLERVEELLRDLRDRMTALEKAQDKRPDDPETGSP